MKKTLKLIAFLFSVCIAANGQVVPEATGPAGPPISGNLNYSFRYSQNASFGSTLGNYQTSNASASVDYSNGKARLPFSLQYGGGYTWNLTGDSYGAGLFQNLFVSQGITGRKWTLILSDNVGFRPQAPTTGFSGVAGTGDPIGTPNPAPPSGQSILTVNTEVVNNSASGQFSRTINSSISLSAGANSAILHYPDSNGLDTNSVSANGSLSWRINARNSLTSGFGYSDFSFPSSGTSFGTESATVGFSRQWTKKLVTSGSLGPQWIQSSESTVVPSSTRLSASAAVSYQMRFGSASLGYSHGTGGGGGYLIGSESDVLNANYSRVFHKKTTLGFTASYMRTAGLDNNGVTDATYGGAQVSRQLGRYMNVFGSYTAINQSTTSDLSSNVFTGLQQVIAFGIGYSPRRTELKR